VKKKIFIIISVLILLTVISVVIYKAANSPIRHFKGEVVNIEKVDHHLVFTVEEDEETQYTVCVRTIKLVTYRNLDEEGYAHNIRIGDHVEGTYYNDWLHKPEFADEMVVIEKE